MCFAMLANTKGKGREYEQRRTPIAHINPLKRGQAENGLEQINHL